MKAQLSYEFYISIVIFIIFIAYLIFRVVAVTPPYTNAIESQRLSVETYQISELLLNNPGQPLNWDSLPISQIKRVGLLDHTKNKTNMLSSGKITSLKTLCGDPPTDPGYENFANKLAIKNFNVSLKLSDTSGNLLASCTPTIFNVRGKNVSLTRFASNGTHMMNLSLQVVG